MSLFLLDTDHLTLYQMGHAQLLRNIALHLADTLSISVVTVEEQLTGWQRALNQAKDDARREQIYQRMAHTVEALSGWREDSKTVSGVESYDCQLPNYSTPDPPFSSENYDVLLSDSRKNDNWVFNIEQAIGGPFSRARWRHNIRG